MNMCACVCVCVCVCVCTVCLCVYIYIIRCHLHTHKHIHRRSRVLYACLTLCIWSVPYDMIVPYAICLSLMQFISSLCHLFIPCLYPVHVFTTGFADVGVEGGAVESPRCKTTTDSGQIHPSFEGVSRCACVSSDL